MSHSPDGPEPDEAHALEAALKPECDSIRADLLAIEKRVRALKGTVQTTAGVTGAQAAEVFGNIMLSVRHIEDARMRVGKVLQHARDGVSIYDVASVSPPPHPPDATPMPGPGKQRG